MKVRIKTKEQMLASGWYESEIGLEHRDACVYWVSPPMDYLFGKVVEVDNQQTHNGWRIDPLMVVSKEERFKALMEMYESQIKQQLLNEGWVFMD